MMYTGFDKNKRIQAPERENPLQEILKLREATEKFVKDYQDSNGDKKYQNQLQNVANLESIVFKLDLEDLFGYNPDFVEVLQKGAESFLRILYDACDKFLPDPSSVFALKELDNETRLSKRIRLQEQLLREKQIREFEAAEETNAENEKIPRCLLRRYSIQIIPETKGFVFPLRILGAKQLGGLVSVKGIVTKVSTIKLQLLVAAYICHECGHEIYSEATEKKFNPVVYCPVQSCNSSRLIGKKLPLEMNNRRSKFRKYQEITMQELPCDTPAGHIPQHIKIEAMDECTMQCKGGDTVTVTAFMMSERLETYQARMNGYKERISFLRASSIRRHSRTLKEISSAVDSKLDERIDKLSLDPQIYSKLAKSLAPEIFGMLDIKKALLLQLVSGNAKNLDDGLVMRGDINICMVGDPGVAKSQLLKTIARISPRAVYTTGKGSSAVGLTASVNKDKHSGEMILEPGALVLADNGICCIDEFDKMTETDRTAIHEVMEQQTVSIAKAGVTTTLNARTSVLAAANPVMGRYNRKLSPSENMDLPAALLSRFDLIFIVLDVPDASRDEQLAKYVTEKHEETVENHRHESDGSLDDEWLDLKTVRAYISQARNIEPSIPPNLVPIIVEEYVAMRQEDKRSADKRKKREQLTPRQLLSLLRLSHGLAKVRLANEVTREDIQESMRLIQATKSDLAIKDPNGKSRLSVEELYQYINRYIDEKLRYGKENVTQSQIHAIDFEEIKAAAFSAGATSTLFDKTITAYIELNVWKKDETGKKLLVSR